MNITNSVVIVCAPSGREPQSFRNDPPQNIRNLQRVRPADVRARAEVLWREEGATKPWLSYAADANIEHVLAIFEAVPERPVTPDGFTWLSRKLPEAGALADRVWALLERDRRRTSP